MTLRFPVPRLRPAGGFSIDPTLVYALTRLESNFDPDAVSPAGARGLMQIMPATAQYITGDLFFEPDRLHEPASNLNIGQRYISYLARQDGIDNDLMRMLASYNAGPGQFRALGCRYPRSWRPVAVHRSHSGGGDAGIRAACVDLLVDLRRPYAPAGGTAWTDLAAGEFPRFTPRGQERRMALLAPGLK